MPIVGIYQGANRLIVSWDRSVGFATREDDSRVRHCASECADGLGISNALRSQVESELTRVTISMNRQKTNPMVKRTAMMNDCSAIAMPWADWVDCQAAWDSVQLRFSWVLRFPERGCSEDMQRGRGIELLGAG